MPKKKHKTQKGVEGRIEGYFSRHVFANSFFHLCAGIGLGALLTHALFDPHPIRWAVGFIAVAAFGHYWAWKTRG